MAGQDPWPEDVRLHRGKMYLKDRLCVPSGLGLKVVGAQHLYGGHMGVKKLVKAVLHRYKFGRGRQIWQLAKET